MKRFLSPALLAAMLAITGPVDAARKPADASDSPAAVKTPATHKLLAHTGPVFALAFSPDSKRLATAGSDKNICLWDTATGKQICRVGANNSGVQCLAFSPDGKHLASGGADPIVKVWDLDTGDLLSKLSVTRGETLVYSLAFSADGKSLVTGDQRGNVITWDWDNEKATHRNQTRKDSTNLDTIIGPDAKYYLIDDRSNVEVYNTKTDAMVSFFESDQATVGKFSTDGSKVVYLRSIEDPDTGASHYQANSWDFSAGKTTSVELTVNGLFAESSPDGSWAVLPTPHGEAILIDLKTAKAVRDLTGPKAQTQACRFSGDGRYFASAVTPAPKSQPLDTDPTVYLWDLKPPADGK